MSKAAYVLHRCQLWLHNPVFIAYHKLKLNAFTRCRKLPFALVVAALIHLCKRRLQIECNLLAKFFSMPTPASKQALSQARG